MRPTLTFLGILTLTAALLAGASEMPSRAAPHESCRTSGWTIDCGTLGGFFMETPRDLTP